MFEFELRMRNWEDSELHHSVCWNCRGDVHLWEPLSCQWSLSKSPGGMDIWGLSKLQRVLKNHIKISTITLCIKKHQVFRIYNEWIYNRRQDFFFNLFICSEFCHTLEWNSHGFTCVPAPQEEFSLRNMYVRGTLCFLLQAKWTPRCPDWKEVQIS